MNPSVFILQVLYFTYEMSFMNEVWMGVPQGGILVPMLFYSLYLLVFCPRRSGETVAGAHDRLFVLPRQCL